VVERLFRPKKRISSWLLAAWVLLGSHRKNRTHRDPSGKFGRPEKWRRKKKQNSGAHVRGTQGGDLDFFSFFSDEEKKI